MRINSIYGAIVAIEERNLFKSSALRSTAYRENGVEKEGRSESEIISTIVLIIVILFERNESRYCKEEDSVQQTLCVINRTITIVSRHRYC